MNKKTVLVLFGGVSSEHEVSRLSVTSVLQNIDHEQYAPVAVGITKDGRWLRFDGDIALIADGSWEKDEKHLCPCLLSPDRSHHGLLLLHGESWEPFHIDVIFPVLHGKNGEDGTVQGLFELAGIPYVGCRVMASANCMDKDVAKRLFTIAGIPNARWITAYPSSMKDFDSLRNKVEWEFGYPAFVKPANAGSSVGVSKAKNPEELHTALVEAFRHDSKVIIEETLHGAEVECAVMGNEAPVASAVIGEIEPLRGLYDYEGKYLDGSTKLHIPARISPLQTEQIQAFAIKAYQALECSGLARIDFFATNDGKVVLNEINTLPGFTNISMYPKLFMASGMSYSEIITKLLNLAEAH
ncbi:MAG: D-alanine--D-alanine ligase family protein [Angelakisella sp.]